MPFTCALIWSLALAPLQADRSAPAAGHSPRLPVVLFLTRSAGFVHDVVRRPEPEELSLAERSLRDAARGRFELRCTQDPRALLELERTNVSAVVLYTTGELDLDRAERDAFRAWLHAGGALVGVHSATDTFLSDPEWVAMLGGAFDGHPWNESVRLRVEDARHPATRALSDPFSIADEIYQFRDFRRHPVRVLLALDGEVTDLARGARADGDYPLAWWRDYGEGRVFYTALGHRPEVWGDERFLQHLVGGLAWSVEGPDLAAVPPPGATVLFDGDLAAWSARAGGPAAWRVLEGGAVEVVPGSGDLVSSAGFGDALVHVEFRLPRSPDGEVGQERANSGVYLHGRYEVQVLDTHGAPPSTEGCAALYGLRAPTLAATRPALRWQSYDIRFRAPRFAADGAKREDARVSVWHNGRLVHDDVALPGPTRAGLAGDEVERGPLMLQDHGDGVRFRNVWWVE